MNLKNTIAIASLIVGGFFLSNCGEEPTTPVVVTPTDTTAPKPVNKFRAGFEIYNLDINTDLTYGAYNKASGQTAIQADGVSSKNSIPGAVSGPGDFKITFEGSGVGTYTQSSGKYINLEVGTEAGIKRNEYGTDDKSGVVVTVTEWGAVGGRIKGTFTGTLKTGINSIVIDQGVFDVLRKADF
jgi:hypothetical protein